MHEAAAAGKSCKVVHVTETLRGGIATYLRSLLPGQLSRYGEQNVKVIAPAGHMTDLGSFASYGIGYSSKGGRGSDALLLACIARKFARSFGADLVHVHSTFAGLTCRPAIRLQMRPPIIIYCAHGWAFLRGTRADGAAAFLERTFAPLSDAIVCVSSHERKIAIDRGIPVAKLHVIANGIPDRSVVANHAPSWPSPKRFVFMGRYDRAKGFDLLLSAFSRLGSAVHLHAFGAAVLGDAELPRVPPNVTLHGWSSFEEIEPYLQTCDALVMPSRWEGCPYAALEAMRAKKAVIGTRVGGLQDVVSDGVTGVLVEPNNAREFSAAIEAITVCQLQAMGRRGRDRYLQLFTAERMEIELAALYEQCRRSTNRPSGGNDPA